MDTDEFAALALDTLVEWAEGYTFPETGSQHRIRAVGVGTPAAPVAMFSAENCDTGETDYFRVALSVTPATADEAP
ncbi:hypothetical protein [Streptomyces sp. NBC_01768]|uniref:hypothetical protein n=1 Tax=Streptomyces sp. NBC_01768 TaxID=2975938 RepID=UPI002DDA4F13|nr:hypothetical protein [Streptomyces sp. NBC_01768]WSC31804.1 hypothetical protein OG902_36725 [Streptomyces sp. NBC_01768]